MLVHIKSASLRTFRLDKLAFRSAADRLIALCLFFFSCLHLIWQALVVILVHVDISSVLETVSLLPTDF
jgi:hypothetical protein